LQTLTIDYPNVTLVTIFSITGAVASIIQQFHYALNWAEIKEAQNWNQSATSLSFSFAAEPAAVGLFLIRKWGISMKVSEKMSC
jgi:hypothetical protein